MFKRLNFYILILYVEYGNILEILVRYRMLNDYLFNFKKLLIFIFLFIW